jgi:spermidine synthase
MLPDKPKLTLFDYPQIIVSSILLKEHARRILMIGLAGASVAKGLNTLVPNIDFDIVEINPSMPKIAHQFFAFSPPPKTKIHIEDGIQFINDTPKNSYDIIIIDAFTKDYIPLSMLTIEFISGLKKALKEDGFIVLNTFTNNKYKEQEIKLLKEIFGTFYAITNDSNMVIFASNGVFPNINEIEKSSVFWRFRLSEIGINQYRIIELFKGMKKYTP